MKGGNISAQKLESMRSKTFLFPFYCKPRPARVSLESPGLENISQVPGDRAELDQNHDARNVVSATVSVLKRWDNLG